jgi:hypothetical protein
MNQASNPGSGDSSGMATICLIVGFCIGLGLGVAALTSYVEERERAAP